MSRLTEGFNGTYALNMGDVSSEEEATNVLKDKFKVACNKLGKLEDLEEQLGIDLLTLFTLIDNEIYRIKDRCSKPRKMMVHVIDYYSLNTLSCGELWESVEIKDFNKTWFLTKKEAEKALKER